MARRLLMFGMLAALSQVGTGCCCVRQCIANRWHYFHGGAGCGACCSPAFKVPAPLPVYHGGPPVAAYHGGPPVAGCPSCYSPPDVGPVAYAGPLPGPTGFSAPPSGIPMLSSPMPLLNGATIEPSTGVPTPMPPKTGN